MSEITAADISKLCDLVNDLRNEVARLEAENADLRSDSYLASVVEERDRALAENAKLLRYAKAHIEREAGIITDGSDALVAELAGNAYGGHYAHELQELRAAALEAKP